MEEGETEGVVVDEGKARWPPKRVFIIIRRHDGDGDEDRDGDEGRIAGFEEGGLLLFLF